MNRFAGLGLDSLDALDVLLDPAALGGIGDVPHRDRCGVRPLDRDGDFPSALCEVDESFHACFVPRNPRTNNFFSESACLWGFF